MTEEQIHDYDHLKKEIKKFSKMYDGGPLRYALDSSRIAIQDLQELVETLQQQKKQSIEALEQIAEADCSQDFDGIRGSLIDVVKTAEKVIQQIQGSDEER